MSPNVATALVIARRVAIVLTFIVIGLRPGFGQSDAAAQLADIDVLVVVDRTRSMAALDYNGKEPRINGVKADLVDLVKELPGARFAMLTFGTDARLTLPFTTDVTAFQAATDTLFLEGPKDGTGSRADRPVPELAKVLERAQEQSPDRRRVVIYLGDGEDTSEDTSDLAGGDPSFADVKDLIVGGVVLGYGTEKGASMPASDDLTIDEGYVLDPATDQTAISKADPDNLRTISDELGVSFAQRTGPGGISRITDDFEASYVEGEGGNDRPAQHDLTWLFGLILLGLVLAELRSGWRSTWSARHTLLPMPTKGGPR